MPATDRKLRVFLCHASQDKPFVRDLYQRLLAEGWIDPWLDEENLHPGQYWPGRIEEEIESTDAVIVLLSNNSVSKEGVVQKEIRRTLDKAEEKPEDVIFVIPLRLENCPIPRRMRNYHYQDYYNNADVAYKRLRTSLEERGRSLGINILQLKEHFKKENEERTKREKLERVNQEVEARLFQERLDRERRWTEERLRLDETEKLAQQKAANEVAEVVTEQTNAIVDKVSGYSCVFVAISLIIYIFVTFVIPVSFSSLVAQKYDMAAGFFFFLLFIGISLVETISGIFIFGVFLYGRYAPPAIDSVLQWIQVNPNITLSPTSAITLGQAMYWSGYAVVCLSAIIATSFFVMQVSWSLQRKTEK